MTFYRKYRPQSLDELVGQPTVKETLKSALSKNSLSHAYLFCGPKGTGKTSTARILAKIINCERSTDFGLQSTVKAEDGSRKSVDYDIPCNQCQNCLSITDGSNLDVIEMDAASNRGIEDIRALRENIKLSPTSAKKKVYIIDEVHMLTGEAFNALLKTLEEPPSHVVFILATTDPQKIPATILSRVQRLDFKQATIEDILQDLRQIVEKEKIAIDQDSLMIIAKKASGSFRDAEKILEQVASFDKVTPEVVEQTIGSTDTDKIISILQAVAKSNPQDAIELILGQLNKGAIPKEMNLSILDMLRQLLLIKNGLGQIVKNETKDETYQVLEKLAQDFELPRLLKILNNFQQSLEQQKYVSIPSLPLEMAIVGSCVMIDQTSNIKDQKESTDLPAEKTTLIPQAAGAQKEKDDQQSQLSKEPSSPESLERQPSADIQTIQEKWTYVLETVRQNNFSLEALLRSSKIHECENNNVIIAVPYSFHQRILEVPKSKTLLESILSDILGRTVKVSTVLIPKPMGRDDIANIEVAQDDEIVRLAAEIFNAESVN